jgi:hypothetical protein
MGTKKPGFFTKIVCESIADLVKNPVFERRSAPKTNLVKPSIRQDLRLGSLETGLMGENTWFEPADSVKNLLVERSRNPVSRSQSASRRAIINYQLSMPNSQFPITDYFRRSSNLR